MRFWKDEIYDALLTSLRERPGEWTISPYDRHTATHASGYRLWAQKGWTIATLFRPDRPGANSPRVWSCRRDSHRLAQAIADIADSQDPLPGKDEILQAIQSAVE